VSNAHLMFTKMFFQANSRQIFSNI
jgi:hypothetical protein